MSGEILAVVAIGVLVAAWATGYSVGRADAPGWRARALVPGYREVIRRCQEQFRDYEAQHRAKHTPEADAKADLNGHFADMCERALQHVSD